jgi:hypothetical protein
MRRDVVADASHPSNFIERELFEQDLLHPIIKSSSPPPHLFLYADSKLAVSPKINDHFSKKKSNFFRLIAEV